jgi:hypothetical protein
LLLHGVEAGEDCLLELV